MFVADIRSVVAIATLFVAATAAQGQSRDTVVETQLAPRAVKAQIRRAMDAASLAPAARVAQARQLIEASRVGGDPRLLGYAEARLGDADDVDALVLRATIEQSRHRFDAALALLDRALRREPAHPQALLTRATIAQVRGDLSVARRDCQSLAQSAPEVAAICTASVDVQSGRDAQGLAQLAAVAERAPALRGWALSLAGEAHERRGALQEAVSAYAASLAAHDDLYTRVALADALLASGRAGEAQAALAHAPATDAVLLRRWRIARRLGEDATALAEQLEQRLAAAQARGELLHAREAAWFALERGEAARALRYARDNWAAQREPADVLLLAAAARAADDAGTLAEVRAWLARTGLRDVRIERLLAARGA
ncbi:MAG: hypothetical protein ACOY5V_05715 [Pseudomonadota bacterium]